ncbi:gallate 1-beta-glucosyltransferase 84A24-like [Tasmannia lanceolata]|uniref:gallate 1-beta-glucosyltransferase 84A24-like n=1 Tax=Tasmannia lanceolata TaxID=3420 RepID=UPI004063AA66
MEEQKKVHVMLVTFAAQGLINPVLELAKILASKGLRVTFTSTEMAGERMRKSTNTSATNRFLQFHYFSDGWGLEADRSNVNGYINQLNLVGPKSLTQLMQNLASQGDPISFIIGNPFLPWVLDVAEEMKIPYAMLWTQPYAVFAIYYRYFSGLNVLPPVISDADTITDITGLPTLRVEDLPTFLLPSNPYITLSEALLETFRKLKKVTWILVNSFIDLEREAIEKIPDVPPVKLVGPLVRIRGSNLRGDMWRSADCLEWLDAQSPSTVVYISFGSHVVRSHEQMEEVAWGLRSSKQPFLWVAKPPENATGLWGLPEGFIEETVGQGKIVDWCPQVEVLSHPSIACFITHCGWNSTLESLVAGVPVVVFPDRGDQQTNAKLLLEVYRIGVGLRRDPSGLVRKEEIERGINEAISGARAMELKENALKWKDAAREAVSDSGTSAQNIQAFVDDLLLLL